MYASGRLYITTIFFVFINTNTFFSQSLPESVQKMEDSLLNKLTIAQNDSLKVKELYKLSQKIYEYDYVKGIKYVNQSIELSKRIEYTKGETWGHFLKGIIFYYMSNYDTSLEELFIAIQLNKRVNSDELYAIIYNYIGINYREIKDLKKSRFYFEKSLEFYTNINYDKGISMINNNIGLILFDLGNYDHALEYLNKAIPPEEKSPTYIANTILNFIRIYLKKGQYETAHNKLLYVNSIKEGINDFLVITEFYYLFGLYYKSINDYDNAIPYFYKSIKVGECSLPFFRTPLNSINNYY